MGSTLVEVATFSERFSELTEGKTCREIADEVSEYLEPGLTISKSAVHNYLSGLRSPKTPILAAIARRYNVNPVWLLGYDVPKYKETPGKTEGLSEDRQHIIDWVMRATDDEVRALRAIADQVLALRGK